MKGFPSFRFSSFRGFGGRARRKGRGKDSQKPSRTRLGFSSKNGIPKKWNCTRKGSRNGSQNLLKVLPGTSCDPPRAATSSQRLPRPSRGTLWAPKWHSFRAFSHHFGPRGRSFATNSVRNSRFLRFTLSTDRKLSPHRISYSYRPHIRSKGAAARGTQVCHTRCLTFSTYIRAKFVWVAWASKSPPNRFRHQCRNLFWDVWV